MTPEDSSTTLPRPRPDPAPTGDASADLSGRTLGDYRIERLLGRGGMGEVYLAHQVSLGRPVAYKVLRAEALANPIALSRFEAEAGAAAKLSHPNIVHIYQLGSIDGQRFLAMEYVHGTNLREYIHKKGPLDIPVALSIMKQAAQAVGAAGEIGLVHRDIKPENLLLTRKGQVKITDFGLCRFIGPEALNLTQQGTTLGTPMYMSPEQVQGKPVDHRSDLYSLGVTFYSMLAGEPPFRAETALGLALKHVQEMPVPIDRRRKDLPPGLGPLVMKLMAKSPDRRYQSAAELLQELSRIKADAAAEATTVAIPIDPPAAVEPAPPASESREAALTLVEEAPETALSRWLRPGRIAAVWLAAAAAGGLLGWRARAADLLSRPSPVASGPAGLWLAPGWRSIPRQADAASQYRFAQIQAGPAEAASAWLAVPGYFPDDRKTSYQAYIQLTRAYFRERDDGRLTALARDLARSGNANDEALARVALAAASALRNDDEALGEFSRINPAGIDPALAELALSVVSRVRATSNDPSIARRLPALRNDLREALKLEPIEIPGLTSP